MCYIKLIRVLYCTAIFVSTIWVYVPLFLTITFFPAFWNYFWLIQKIPLSGIITILIQIISLLPLTKKLPHHMQTFLLHIDIFHSGVCFLILLDYFPLIFGDERRSKSLHFHVYTWLYSPYSLPISVCDFLIFVVGIYTAWIGLWLEVSHSYL